jgi:ribulose-5-phosphate 4-epimerase/fuculose-1-phosphate aldolase
MTATADTTQLREDLVTCTRLLVHNDVLDYSGHLSARIPGTDLVLIQPRDRSRAALTADDLLVIDLDGTLVEGSVPPPAEAAIHTGVYRARPDVSVICHGHPTLSTTFTMTDQPMRPMRHFAYKFPDGLAVHPDTTHIRTREQGDAVAATLGDAGACLLRSHGTVVVGSRIDELFMDCLDIEENARTQLMAVQLGGALLPLTSEEIATIDASYSGLGHRPGKMWEHYIHRGRVAGYL